MNEMSLKNLLLGVCSVVVGVWATLLGYAPEAPIAMLKLLVLTTQVLLLLLLLLLRLWLLLLLLMGGTATPF